MSRPTKRRPPGRPARNLQQLSRERVLRGALALLDREGLAGVSMRGLARLLGVTPMSLYNYFPTRDALLDALHEAGLAQMPRPSADVHAPWKEAVIELARTLRGALRAHPNALLLFATRPVRTPGMLRVIDERLGQLRRAGFPPRQALFLVDCLFMLTVGHALAEFGDSPAAALERDGRDLVAQDRALAAAGLDEVRRVAVAGSPHDYDAEIEAGLHAVVDGFEVQLRGRLSPARRRR